MGDTLANLWGTSRGFHQRVPQMFPQMFPQMSPQVLPQVFRQCSPDFPPGVPPDAPPDVPQMLPQTLPQDVPADLPMRAKTNSEERAEGGQGFFGDRVFIQILRASRGGLAASYRVSWGSLGVLTVAPPVTSLLESPSEQPLRICMNTLSPRS